MFNTLSNKTQHDSVDNPVNKQKYFHNLISETHSSLISNINYHNVYIDIGGNNTEYHENQKKIFEELLLEFNELKSRVDNFDKIINNIEKDLDAIEEQINVSDYDKRRIIGFLWLKKSFIKNKEIKLNYIIRIKNIMENDTIFQ